MNMITLTWFQALQVLGIVVIALILPTLAKVTRQRDADLREVRRRTDERVAALMRGQHH